MNEQRTVRLLLADDHELVIEGLRGLLQREPDMQVVAAVTDGARLLSAVREHQPDIVIMDLAIPPEDGFTYLRAIRETGLPVKVILLTAFGDGASLQTAWELQADGFALKTDPPHKTITTIRNVAQGQIVFPRAVRQAYTACEQGPLHALTQRERDVLRLMAAGLPNAQIAERLTVQESTVKFHLQNIFQKLGVGNRTEAARLYYHASGELAQRV
jgi:DNA-binding NarL/FixJ family response regulator